MYTSFINIFIQWLYFFSVITDPIIVLFHHLPDFPDITNLGLSL